MIDWDMAISTGVRFARQGPQVSLTEARAVVAELRGLTAVVQQPVRDLTGLTSRGAVGPVAVVDRPGWIRANVGGFRVVLEPLAEQLAERANVLPTAGSVVGTVGSRVTGVQAGLILAYLSSRVLGQYELFLPPGEGGRAGERRERYRRRRERYTAAYTVAGGERGQRRRRGRPGRGCRPSYLGRAQHRHGRA